MVFSFLQYYQFD